MGIAAAVGGSAIIGGFAQNRAAGQAASAQRHAAAQANATEQQFFNTANTNLQPYIQAGDAATGKVSELEGLNGGNASTIQATLEGLPGYQFANYQGLKSVQNQATERGLGLSGAALKGAANYSTGLANQYYNNLLTGIQNTANTGAQSAQSLAGLAVGTGGEMGSNILGAGQATAAGQLAQGAGIATAAGGLPSGLLTSQLLQNQNNLSNAQTSYYNNLSGQAPAESGLQYPQGINLLAPG